MKNLILILIFLLSLLTSFAQDVVELGMSENEILELNQDICFHDTLDDGTKYIKAMVSYNKNYIYYFFNNKDECFCVILYFVYENDLNNFKDSLDLYYAIKPNNKWESCDKKYFISQEDIGVEFPVLYTWSSKYTYPKEWEFLEDMK
jgi:hypothetical protein